jgi:hypothetical protein
MSASDLSTRISALQADVTEATATLELREEDLRAAQAGW